MSTRKFNKDRGEDMKAAFNRANQGLDDIANEVAAIANRLAAGGLLGQTGDALTDVLGNTLVQKINLLSDKMKEMKSDVNQAKFEYEEAERRAQARFVY